MKKEESLSENIEDELSENLVLRENENDLNEEFGSPDLISGLFSVFNARPLLAAALGFSLGIVVCFYAYFSDNALFFSILALVLAFLIIGLGLSKLKRLKLALLLFAIMFLIGGLRVGVSLYRYSSCENVGVNVAVYGRVEEVKVYDDRVIVLLGDISFRNKKSYGKARVYLYGSFVKKAPEKYERVCVSADFSRAVDYYGKNGKYAATSDIYYVASLTYGDFIARYEKDLSFFEQSREYVSAYLKQAISSENYGTVLAMLTGDTSFLEGEVLNTFRLSGIAHVFAVSGLHIGLFSAIFLFLAERLRILRLKKCAFVLLPTLFYVGVCGFSSSAVRAFIMLSVGMICVSFGVKNDAFSSLSIAALILAIVNPFCIFSAGWLLSFAAVAGIFLFAPWLKRGTQGLPKRLGESASVTLAAQIGTLPILTDMCGYMSIISTFANLFLLPMVSLLYQLLAIISMFNVPLYALGVSPGVLSAITFLPDNALSAITAVLSAIELENFAVPFKFGALAIFYYAAALAVSDFTNLKVKRKIAFFTCFTICFLRCL